MREINLSGSETSIIKALGLGGSAASGETLIERVANMEGAELLDSLHGLILSGYVDTDTRSLRTVEQMKKAEFQVNTSYLRDLRRAMDPRSQQPTRRRRRS